MRLRRGINRYSRIICMDLLSSIVTSFITIFAIMDPFSSVPSFLTLTQGSKKSEMISIADKSVIIAGVMAVVFLLAGPLILGALSITLSDFRIAGGIVLVLLGIENTLDITFNNGNKKGGGLDSVAVLIATPLLTGPGLMTSLVILNQEDGILPVFISLLAALFISWIVLRKAPKLRDIIGDRVIMVFSKVMGLFLIAVGIAFIRGGLAG